MVEKSKALGYKSFYAYMKDLGIVIEEENIDEKLEKLVKEIKEIFKGDLIEAREIYANNLYYRIREICIHRQITIRNFFENLGYRYERVVTQVSKFDYKTLRRIHKEYAVYQSELARMFDTTRQIVNNIINNKVNEAFTGESWLQTSLDDEQEELILEMITDRINEKKEEELYVNITCDGKGKLLFVFKIGDCIKVIFDENIPSYLHELLDEVGMSTLLSEEREFLKTCTYAHIVDKRVIQKSEAVDRAKWKKFKKNYYKRRKIEEKEDCSEIEIYGFINNKTEYTYEKIVERLSEVADNDNGVVTTDEVVAPIYRHYSHYRNEYTDKLFDYSQFENFDFFLNYHGFHLRGRHAQTEETKQKRRINTDDKYRRILHEYIIVPETKMVSFSSYEPIYGALFQTLKLRNMNIYEYISYLGYEFVMQQEIKDIEDDTKVFEEIFNIYQKERTQMNSILNQYQRNKLLVSKMKKAYQCRCQLCDSDNTFEILINEETGEKYVEVHHIVPNCEGEDEEGTLDRPDNMIVVCPNHHMFLHYHMGGNYRLVKENEILYLQNQKQRIEVKCDKHLKKYMSI